MRPRPDAAPTAHLTRRSLAGWLAASAAVIGLARPAAGAAPAGPLVVDPVLRDAALRGLALADHRGDAVSARAARAAMARLADTDPDGALLCRLYRKLDVRPASYWHDDVIEAVTEDLERLHGTITACRPVHFRYTDLSGQCSERTVLPLALVHPPQGVKLLAWCEKAEDFRQFFVRSMQGLATRPGDFSADRLALLTGLVEKEGA
ncbi:WYL domain-containing protein [Gemmobacter sp.]|uniref:WYL domain-containing protein n=1 Tax=Gemmobacter sp. TaxID=1898957 RepID=UPI002AFEE5BE|nr:WYL domain-containing protein [Gemmobacter sp.]